MRHRLSAALVAKLPVSLARKVVQAVSASIHDGDAAPRQLLVDISEIIQQDARTGIQRVVRGILQQLLAEPPEGYQVKPVFAERLEGYRYAPVSVTCLQADAQARHAAMPVVVAEGDVFLGLDLAAHLVPRHQSQFLKWKRCGVRVCFVVYDLLPLLHPHWFKPVRRKTFRRWLKILAIYCDDLICISESVKVDLTNWLLTHYNLPDDALRLHTVPLGADLEATMPSSGISGAEQAMLEQLQQRKFVLMVGTLEPRKGYADALAAFERLWAAGELTALVIVGRPGWKMESFQETLRSHPEQKKRLYWFEHASDELLQELYKAAYGILLASEAEGFGLPLAEALRYGKPVLARDINVYREVNRGGITFFDHATFAVSLVEWLQMLPQLALQASIKCHVTWAESAKHVYRILSSANTNLNLREIIPER